MLDFDALEAAGIAHARERAALIEYLDSLGLGAWVVMKSAVGDDATLGVMRVLGASMARLAEAGSTAIRLGLPDIHMAHSQDELTTAQAYRAVGEFIPRLAVLIDAVFRTTRSAPAPTSRASSATRRRAWCVASGSRT